MIDKISAQDQLDLSSLAILRCYIDGWRISKAEGAWALSKIQSMVRHGLLNFWPSTTYTDLLSLTHGGDPSEADLQTLERSLEVLERNPAYLKILSLLQMTLVIIRDFNGLGKGRGICSAVSYELIKLRVYDEDSENYFPGITEVATAILGESFRHWPKHSGSTLYPIPAAGKLNRAYEKSLVDSCKGIETEYSRDRLELLGFSIKYISDKLDRLDRLTRKEEQ